MHLVVFGATSAIAQSLQRHFAKRGWHQTLIGRNAQKLAAVQADLETRYQVKVETIQADLADPGCHGRLFETLREMPAVDVAVLAYGTLPDQATVQADWTRCAHAINVNYLSAVSILNRLAELMEARGCGRIGVITSVAGDRGRQSNYIYGSTKGALSLVVEGMRHRFANTSISVTDIRPGFVATPMTAHLKQGPLFAQPDAIAPRIATSILKRRAVVYVPWFWRWIMLLVRWLPRFLFHRTNL